MTKTMQHLNVSQDWVFLTPSVRQLAQMTYRLTIFHFQMFAAEGLRTLVVAYKDISMDMYTEWEAKYKAAR